MRAWRLPGFTIRVHSGRRLAAPLCPQPSRPSLGKGGEVYILSRFLSPLPPPPPALFLSLFCLYLCFGMSFSLAYSLKIPPLPPAPNRFLYLPLARALAQCAVIRGRERPASASDSPAARVRPRPYRRVHRERER